MREQRLETRNSAVRCQEGKGYVLVAHPSRVTTRFGYRVLAGIVILSVVLALSPTITMAQPVDVGAYLGYDTPSFDLGDYTRVTTDDGGGLRLRSGAGLRYEEVSALSDGDLVQIVDGPFYDGESNGWYLVTNGATTAFAYGAFLTASDAQSQPTSNNQNQSGYLGYDTPSFAAGQSVVVITDDGQGLRIRTGPGTGAERIATLGDGDIVTIVDGPVYDGSSNGWYLVSDGAIQGYAFAGFLTDTGTTSSNSSASTSAGEYLGYEIQHFDTGSTATVRTDDGGGLNIRSGPSLDSETVRSVSDGSAVTIINGPYYDGAKNGWYAISVGDDSGFVYAGFLTGGTSSSTSSTSTSSSSTGYLGYDTPSFSVGQNVKVLTDDGGGLRVRDGASTGSKQLATLGDGDVITIVDGPVYDGSSNGWYLISDGSFEGYAFAGFLTATSSTSTSTSTSSSSSSAASSVPSGVARFEAGTKVSASESVNVRNGASIVSGKRGVLNTGDTAQIVDGPFYDSDGDDWYYIESGSLAGFTMGAFLKAAAVAASQTTPAKAFIYPLSNYTFTQAFGCSPYSFEPYNANLGCYYHNGIDLAAPSYTPIKASAAGTVIASGWCDCGLGYYVSIDHGNGYKTTYGHMAEQPWVSVGQWVSQGETIGPIGSTGMSTGPHIHFVVQQNGVDIDPLSVL